MYAPAGRYNADALAVTELILQVRTCVRDDAAEYMRLHMTKFGASFVRKMAGRDARDADKTAVVSGRRTAAVAHAGEHGARAVLAWAG